MKLLEASTPEAHLISKNVLESFLESIPDNKSLRHWLYWWHDRRRNIFCVFAGHDHSRCNKAEVVRASWKNRDCQHTKPQNLTLVAQYYQGQSLWKLLILQKGNDVVLH